MKKKVIYALFIGLLTISLCACGKKQGDSQEATTESAEEQSSDADKVVVDAEQYVTLPDYKAIEVEVAASSITDEDISTYITENMLTSYIITDRPVQLGDIANIDYIGKKDGVAFDGGTAEGYDLTIGSGQFISGFEDGLIGVSTGETVDLNLTFPKQYQSEELAGQDVVFTVTVNAIKGKTDFEKLTVEQLISMDIGFETKEDLWEAGKKAYAEQEEENHKLDIQNAVYEKLLEETTFAELPQELVDQKVKEYNDYMENMCQQYFGCSLETYVTSSNQSMDEYNEQVKEMAEQEAKQELLFDLIAKNEAIEVTDEDLMEKAQEMAEQYNYGSAEAFLELIGKEEFRLSILQQNVVEFLGENAVVNEK